MKRTVIHIVGESGSGLVSTGEICMKALKKKGFYIHTDREYPSLIKGGYANFQINFSTDPINSLTNNADLVMAIDRTGLRQYFTNANLGGVIIHGDERCHMMPGFAERVKERKLKSVYLPARHIAEQNGGTELMTNMVLLGVLWKTLGFELKHLEEEVKERFASKPKFLEIDLKCLHAGYDIDAVENLPKLKIKVPEKVPKTILLNGNMAIALGAVHAGVRAYYAYPMSPASSILTYMADFAKETGMLVKQGEDEITVAQMALGSMHMGTRALAATSGGGFDLMTETISLAGITETPLVLVLCQRPGPGTGLPTWTAQGDLHMAIHSGHGEFPRIVIAASDQESCFNIIQHACNLAETYQSPVIILSEKVICESATTIPHFKLNKIPVRRGLVTDPKELEALTRADRYKINETGISKRWIPGSSKTYYFSNGDEHWEDGTLAEDAPEVEPMYKKRMLKMRQMEKSIPEPVVYGHKVDADVSIIGWGSTKPVMMDVIRAAKEQGINVNYLHYEYMWPFKTKTALEFFKNNKHVCLLEGNYNGQLGTMLEDKTHKSFVDKFLKYNGRPFFFDEVMKYIKKQSRKK